MNSDTSGDAKSPGHAASPDDLGLTAKAIAAGRLLDVDVLNSIVVAREGWVSLRDRGITFDRPTSR